MSIYSDKLAQVQVVFNCQYSIAQLHTREDGFAYISGSPSIDDFMRYNSLTTILKWGIAKCVEKLNRLTTTIRTREYFCRMI